MYIPYIAKKNKRIPVHLNSNPIPSLFLLYTFRLLFSGGGTRNGGVLFALFFFFFHLFYLFLRRDEKYYTLLLQVDLTGLLLH